MFIMPIPYKLPILKNISYISGMMFTFSLFIPLISETSSTVDTNSLAILSITGMIISFGIGMKIRKNKIKVLQKNTFKKMLVIGKQDPALEYEPLIKQVKNTNVKVAEFPDGHMSHVENKTELFHTIRNFIWSCN